MACVSIFPHTVPIYTQQNKNKPRIAKFGAYRALTTFARTYNGGSARLKIAANDANNNKPTKFRSARANRLRTSF